MPRKVRVARWGAFALCLAAAAILLYAVRLPYWEMKLVAPQYPQGLTLRAHLDRVEGDVEEVGTLNHYIGVKNMDEAATFERWIGVPAVYLLAGSLLLAPFAGRKKLWVLAIPAIGFPAGFVLDLAYWLHRMATDLDPHAPVHLKAFHFVLWGDAKIGQFLSHTDFMIGFALASVAAVLAILGVVLREVIACRACPHRETCGFVCKGAVPWSKQS